MNFTPINYSDLTAKQQENYNANKLGGVLADYGFHCIRLSDDWQGADLIAVHIDGSTFLKIQLKGRCTISKKYLGKDIYIAFCTHNIWYLYPHDEIAHQLLESTNIAQTDSWNKGTYSFPHLSNQLENILHPYLLTPSIL